MCPGEKRTGQDSPVATGNSGKVVALLFDGWFYEVGLYRTEVFCFF